MNTRVRSILLVAAASALFLTGCERPPVDTIQRGYRGLAMGLVYNPRTAARVAEANQSPAADPAAPAEGVPASSVYTNIQVLKDLNVAQFARLMVAMTQWVAPADQSCAYCHSGADMASDENYRKVVARQMLRMVRKINTDWTSHVAATGVTCYTCHRGNAVPQYVWYNDPGPAHASEMAGNLAGQNAASYTVGLTALPNDPFSPFLASSPSNIRVASTTALPAGSRVSIKQTEWTYGLMVHMSQALGVNCTYCHNTQSFTSWSESTPQRATAWYGLRMVREANNSFLEPLAPTLPADRKGPLGDVAKVNCETCHQGVYKPLYGVGQLVNYPELAAPPAPPAAAADAQAAAAGVAAAPVGSGKAL